MFSEEIEFGSKITNSRPVIDYLSEKADSQKIIEVSRDIYKQPGSRYFLKFSYEETDSGTQHIFSLKEDLIKQGIIEGLKTAEEIDLPVTAEQLESLKEIFIRLGFEQTDHLEKTRHEFTVDDLSVAVDFYGQSAYLEIEGDNKEEIMSLWTRIEGLIT